MIAGLSLGSDNKRYFRGQLPRLAIITIIFMPLLYGAMYLWAFWNPFGAVDKIPAAIVNLDEGATVDGTSLKAGKQVVSSLIESGQLDLTEVSASEAESGLADGTYYFTITLPANFSKALTSPLGGNPHKAKLTFTFNDANNYLSTIIGQDASEQVINKINSTIGADALNQVLIVLENSASDLTKVMDNAEELTSGLALAETGAKELASGAGSLADGLSGVQRSTEQIAAGTHELRTKVDDVIEPAMRKLGRERLERFDARIATLAARAQAGLRAVEEVERNALVRAVDNAVEHLRASPDPVARLAGDALAAAVADLRADLRRNLRAARGLHRSLRSLARDLQVATQRNIEGELARMEQTIAANLRGLSGSVAGLNTGAVTLGAALAGLAAGGTELARGSSDLAAGAGDMLAGANALQADLEAALDKVPKWSKEQREATADTLSTPVGLHQELDNEASTFGVGFAPFFSSLALFVGGVLTWMLLTPLLSRAVVSGLGLYRTALASYVPALIVGALQATILFLVIRYGLGLEPTHGLWMLAFMILISAAFLAMIQMFNAVFDIAIGRVVTLAFLMVQLISAGGIYPVPTTAGPFQVIHPLDPMTYTVDGLRQLTVAEQVDSRLWVAIAVLLGIVLVAISITALAVRRNRQYTMERLYPSIEV